MDEDHGEEVGVRLLFGERPAAPQAVLADPYGGVTATGPRGAG